MPLLVKLTPLQSIRSARQLGNPGLLRGVVPLPAVRLLISGVSRDKDGVVLPTCAVALYRTSDDAFLERVFSDLIGWFTFSYIGLAQTYYIVGYKTGTPVRGTTDNTLVGTVNG